MGMVSSIGMNVEEAFDSLKRSKSGIGPINYLETSHKKNIKAGEIQKSNDELSALAGTTSDKYDRTTLLGMIAVKEALNHARISNTEYADLSFISSTTVGGMSRSELLYPFYLKHEPFDSFIETHDCGESTQTIAGLLGIKGFTSTVSTACSSSANAIMLGCRMIKNNMCERVIVGGTDALSKFTLNGFNALQILDADRCKPFDENRKGLNLGEGAGYLILESESSVSKRNKKIWAEITGYGNTSDAYHQTASSPNGEGAFLAMQKTLAMANVRTQSISYINAHGTGTANNDLSEGTAIKRLFENNIPKFSSTKAYTGHTLGASGSIEAVITTLSINHKTIFPNLNFTTPISSLNISPQSNLLTNFEIKMALSNSFGFGGNCTSLLFKQAS